MRVPVAPSPSLHDATWTVSLAPRHRAQRASCTTTGAAISAAPLPIHLLLRAGATLASTQQRLGLLAPFLAPLYDRDVQPSPAVLPPSPRFRVVGVEAEIVFAMHADLPPRDGDYTSAEVLAAIEWVAPAIEVVGSRFACEPTRGTPLARSLLSIADQASHGALIVARLSRNRRRASSRSNAPRWSRI